MEFRVVACCLLLGTGAGLAANQEWTQLMIDGRKLQSQGEFAAAAPVFRKAIRVAEAETADSRLLLESLNALGKDYFDLGRYNDAVSVFHRAITLVETKNGKRHPSYAMELMNLAATYERQEQMTRAEMALREAVEIFAATVAAGDVRLAGAQGALAQVLVREKKHAEAESLLLASREALEYSTYANQERLASVLSNLASVRMNQGRTGEGVLLYEDALRQMESVAGPKHPHVLRALINLAVGYAETGRTADAEPLLARALNIAEKRLGPDHPEYLEVLVNYAWVLRKAGKRGEAKAMYARCKAAAEAQPGGGGPLTVDARDITQRRGANP